MKNDQRPELCLEFLGWQCRVRQQAVRLEGGRPPRGVQAAVNLDGRFAGRINTVMNKLDPERITAEFRFMVQKTNDPRAVYENALGLLGEHYYRVPAEFDDRLTALFALDSELAGRLLAAGNCELGFAQGDREYRLASVARDCLPGSAEYEAAYWHNHLFNPGLPGRVRVVLFETDWDRSGTGNLR